MYNKVCINIFSIEITIQNAICNVVWIILNRCFPNPTYVGNRRRGYSWHHYKCLFWVVWIMKILLRHWAKQFICNWHLGWMTFCTCCAHIEHHIVIFFLQKLALLSHRYWGTVFICILYIVINSAFLFLSLNDTQRVPKYEDSFHATRSKTVPILALFICTLSDYQYPKLYIHHILQKHIIILVLHFYKFFLHSKFNFLD